MSYEIDTYPSQSLIETRAKLAETINRVQYGRERIVLRRHGKCVAVVVPIEDLELLERLEDEADARVAAKRLKSLESGKVKPIPWSRVRADMLRRESAHRAGRSGRKRA
jgi:prevent-host-death family protein